MCIFRRVVTCHLRTRAVCLVGKTKSYPKILPLGHAENARDDTVEIGQRQHVREAKCFLVGGGKTKKVRSVDLFCAWWLNGLEELRLAILIVNEQYCPLILQSGEVIEVVIFPVNRGFRFRDARPQERVASLELLGKLCTTPREFLRSTEIVNGSHIGVLRE